ncbi:methylenetetrahydrofolate reductase [Ruania alba]|uniref:Methylenetetrahydrofolate reductase n=1 Tax=Ruania alba TaxID=648782 RepID=A0A1H5LH04_9MICO|nr:methylenetetrahydrofolate reductase [Ruania alba]SEE76264.1 methylenetetrahydrofolate reductase (NADPH) [Ruania alba]
MLPEALTSEALPPEALVSRWLRDPRYEVMPTDDVVDEVAAHLEAPATVTVTFSPTRSAATTVSIALRLAALGHRAVPHLAARRMRDRAELEDIAARLADGGINEVFVVGGDADSPTGAFSSAIEVVRPLREISPGLSIGVAGYPESHPHIPDAAMHGALAEKAAYADRVVSQICFSPQTTLRWACDVRARGIELDVLAGIAAPVPRGRLLRIATRIGVAQSARFLSGHPEMLRLGAGRYDPGPLLWALAEAPTPISGIHIYTFNAMAAVQRWRRSLLDPAPEAA